MTSDFKPLLAETCTDITKLRYPVLASPKLDGIRCVVRDGKALSRKLKPIPNDYIRTWIEMNLRDGLDGELMLRNMPAPRPMTVEELPEGEGTMSAFSQVSSAIMSRDGEPDFVYNVFDLLADETSHTDEFWQRFRKLQKWIGPGHSNLQLVPHILAETPEELQAIVDSHVDLGYEGTMVRDPKGRYKFGRSTVKEGILLKIKSFLDETATIIGVVEQMHNGNEATKDNLGHTKRSSAKTGKTGTGKMGALRCRLPDGTEFEVGTGFTDVQRQEPWAVGSLVDFKHQPPPGGRNPGESPRFPVFLRLRHVDDV